MLNEFQLYKDILPSGTVGNPSAWKPACVIYHLEHKFGRSNRPFLISKLILRGELFPRNEDDYKSLSPEQKEERLNRAKTALLCYLGEEKAVAEHKNDDYYSRYFATKNGTKVSGLEYLESVYGKNGRFFIADDCAESLVSPSRMFFANLLDAGKVSLAYYKIDAWTLDLLVSDALAEGPFRRIEFVINPDSVKNYYKRGRIGRRSIVAPLLCAVYIKARIEELDKDKSSLRSECAFIKNDEWCALLGNVSCSKSGNENPLTLELVDEYGNPFRPIVEVKDAALGNIKARAYKLEEGLNSLIKPRINYRESTADMSLESEEGYCFHSIDLESERSKLASLLGK